jgi:hypothetical protein
MPERVRLSEVLGRQLKSEELMNCKQGDLAIYVGAPVMAVEKATGIKLAIVPGGMICRCVSLGVVNDKVGWNIEPRSVSLLWPSGRSFSTTVDAISDDHLRPLRDSDSQNEILRLVGLPAGTPQAA